MCTLESQRQPAPMRLWVYAYHIVPPQPKRRLDTIRELLEHEHAAARKTSRTWAGRLVLERRATRVLIVSDSPDQTLTVNYALAFEVRRLHGTFTLTESMEIPGDTAVRAGNVAHAGNGNGRR